MKSLLSVGKPNDDSRFKNCSLPTKEKQDFKNNTPKKTCCKYF